jgi:hypothetical protein
LRSVRSRVRPAKRKLFREIERALAGHTQALVAVSPGEAETFVASGVVERERVRVVCNGIDPKPWLAARASKRADLGLRDDVPLAGVIGLLNVAKGQDLVLDALAMSGLERLHVLFAGSGALENALKERARRLRVDERVRFLGFRDDVPALLAASDFTIVPSRWEGMPYVVLESMASARAVVATPVDGSRDLVVHVKQDCSREQSPPNRSRNPCARCSSSTARERARMGERGRERMLAHYSADAMVAGLAASIARLQVKILHVITTLDVGGAEMHLLAQVRGQSSRGHDVGVAYLKGHGTLAPDFVAPERARYASGRCAERSTPPAATHGARDLVHYAPAEGRHARRARRAALGPLESARGEQAQRRAGAEEPLVSRVHGLLGNVPRRTIVLSDHVGRFIEHTAASRAARSAAMYYGLEPALSSKHRARAPSRSTRPARPSASRRRRRVHVRRALRAAEGARRAAESAAPRTRARRRRTHPSPSRRRRPVRRRTRRKPKRWRASSTSGPRACSPASAATCLRSSPRPTCS